MLSDLRRLAADWPADQLFVIALCVVALLFAAVAAPHPNPSDAREPTGPGENATQTAPSPEETGETADPSEGTDGGETRPVEDGDPGGELLAPTCSIVVPARVVPGDRMAVVVRSPRGPVAGAEVFVNDRSIGVTDDSGTVATRVPYERRLTVAADLPSDAACQPPETVTVERAGIGVVAAQTATTATPENGTDRIERTVTVRGTLVVSVTGDLYPGSVVTVRAAIGSRPVPNATVTLDGDRTGRTDSSGRARVRLPESGETVQITVERGDFAGTREIDIAHLRASLSADRLLATPGDPATIRVTAGDDPVPDATVELRGADVARSDADGTAAVTLPGDPFATYRVSGADQTTRVAVWPTYLLTAILGVIPVVAGIGVLALVGLAVAWGRSGAPDAISTVETPPPTPDLAPVEHPDLTRERLRERYRAFARRIAPREWATTPPGAIARRAIEAGEPADAVATLTAVFREIEYGDRPLDADRADRAAEALDRLEEP
ncbi:DUF4129 domain-containing protein [Halococcoides cellulosivorans]|uniref:Protein-glutamine gamma-glutamyltransferase-like C-terminal domain-containing protein n=1 Tax=Halococcoides cellulosivorans TaxID=1679096 RepID=A0A2R4X2X1_9EURY|nr:DUF4129 domain-containing protein [Halococcoides cellulosivorans]AWB28140.1 hypothetical protein HARCEL1_10705 [Halococcoides cellulosivorans]